MREKPDVPFEHRVQLVFDVRPEPLAHQDLWQDRVARLLETEHRQLFDRRQHLRIEVALFDARRVDEHDSIDAERRRGRKDFAQRLRSWHREQEIDAGPRRRPIVDLRPQHELGFRERLHLGDSASAAQHADAKHVSRRSAKHLARVHQPAAGEARGAVRRELLRPQQ